ncbi:MAG TPA: type II toxin-antitoxin system MqsR family toxin [Pseudolabrys sp.]
MTEKKTPTHDLAAFKAAMSDRSKLNATGVAIRDAAALGFGSDEIVAAIQTMAPKHFYKSMTSNYDHKVWQDVYFVPSTAGELYIKFTGDPVFGFRVLSFKEKT